MSAIIYPLRGQRKSEGLLRGLQENPLNMSRDEYDKRVRRNYAERQQAEADARYEDFDIADAVKIADDVYSARKVDGTIKSFLDASDDPIAELTKMSGSIAKTAPIKVPEGATIKPKVANKGYYHMEYKWIGEDGYEYTTRWHTRNPTAPLEQRDVWIIERKLPGIGAGLNHRQGLHQVRVGNNKWITYAEWRSATFANQNGFATELQKEWLKNGHWKA